MAVPEADDYTEISKIKLPNNRTVYIKDETARREATVTYPGLMSVTDKIKLNNIEAITDAQIDALFN